MPTLLGSPAGDGGAPDTVAAPVIAGKLCCSAVNVVLSLASVARELLENCTTMALDVVDAMVMLEGGTPSSLARVERSDVALTIEALVTVKDT
jgi:hypothetical protein